MSGCDDPALIRITLLSATTAMAASVTDEQMSPMTKLTLSDVMRRRSGDTPCAGWQTLSAGTTCSARPSTPPAALSSSAARPAPVVGPDGDLDQGEHGVAVGPDDPGAAGAAGGQDEGRMVDELAAEVDAHRPPRDVAHGHARAVPAAEAAGTARVRDQPLGLDQH